MFGELLARGAKWYIKYRSDSGKTLSVSVLFFPDKNTDRILDGYGLDIKRLQLQISVFFIIVNNIFLYNVY